MKTAIAAVALGVSAAACATPSREVAEPQAPAVDVETAVQLAASGESGMFGVPLPEGATLTESWEADVARGRDAGEEYSIGASQEDIEAFFFSEMREAGWTLQRPTFNGSFAFTRAGQRVALVTMGGGAKFTLFGSMTHRRD